MANNGVILEPSEFYYLLRTVEATGVVGIDNSRLFPSDPAMAEARAGEGFHRLQEHGWLRPGDKPRRYHLDDTLVLMVAVVADPELVVLAARQTGADQTLLATEYMGGKTIVELSVTPEGNYHLAVVPDQAAMLRRVVQLLALPAEVPIRAQVSLDEPALTAIQQLAEGGRTGEAAAQLRGHGLSQEASGALAAALASPSKAGLVAVLRQGGGKVLAGRKAAIHRNGSQAWVAERVDATSSQMTVEAVSPADLENVLDRILQSLASAGQPAA